MLSRDWLRQGLHQLDQSRVLHALGGDVPGEGRALEIGGGDETGVQLIFDRFRARRVDALDLDPRLARKLAGRDVHVTAGDVSAIAAPDGTYDAVFDFALLHDVHDWRRALKEIFRVLKPGGRIYAEEVMSAFIAHPLWNAMLEHRIDDRFDARTFEHALLRAGFVDVRAQVLASSFAWFVAVKPGT